VVHVTDGTFAEVKAESCDVYANFRPFATSHFGPQNKLGRLPKGSGVLWRYVVGRGASGPHQAHFTHVDGDYWVMVHVTKSARKYDQGVVWAFVPYHGCFGPNPRLEAVSGHKFWVPAPPH
jgi:hypothetical protein